MRLIIELHIDYYYKNLLMSNKVIVIILDKYIDISYYDLVLIIREVVYKRPQISIINITHAIYMLLYYVLLFLYSDPG